MQLYLSLSTPYLPIITHNSTCPPFSDSNDRSEYDAATHSDRSDPDIGYASSNCCPASPTTVPRVMENAKHQAAKKSSQQVSLQVPPKMANGTAGAAAAVKNGPPRNRRVRTTSMNAESIIRNNNRTIYTAGRPPWYNSAGSTESMPFVIGICGGTASGKTTVAEKIIKSLDVSWVTLLSMDCFYKILTEKEHHQALRNEYNFDHPDAFDLELMADVLRKLKEGKKVDVPIYNFVTHSRETQTKTMYGANVIIFEGILVFHSPEILELLDMKIFVDTDADVRLARRLKRDISERGRDMTGVLKQYNTMVQPSYANYIAPTMAHADIIIPRGGDNVVAIQLIVQHVQAQLHKRGSKLRENLAQTADKNMGIPDNLFVLPSTPQIQGLHTFIRNAETPRDEFIFYSKRLIRLVIEYGLGLLPFKEVTVETPQGIAYQGRRIATNKICGVSILRAGETMEQAVCDVCKDIRIGKILIQTNQITGEPEVRFATNNNKRMIV